MAASLRQRFLRVLCCGEPPRASSRGDPGHGGGTGAQEALLMEGFLFKRTRSSEKGYEDDSKSDSSETLLDREIQLEDSQEPRASSEAPGGISCEIVCDAPNNKDAEEEPTEGDPGKGETDKGETTKGEPTEGDPAKEETAKGEPTEGDPAKEETAKGEPTEGEPAKEETAKGEPTEGDPAEEETAKGQPAEGEPTEREPGEGETAKGETADGGREEEKTTDTNPDSFESRYTVGELLGKGGCGSVYEGVRKVDGNQVSVAMKYVVKDEHLRFTRIPGETELLPVEVALMRMVSRPPASPYVLKLLEWFDTPERCILILERPVPCVDLYQLMLKTGRLRMQFARHVMRQVVLAVLHCRDRGVLHRDIKRQNVLLNTETLEVKLIDFGCGDLLKDTPYYTYSGTWEYSPPEWITKQKYYGCPATVWSLGVLLFFLVCGRLPFRSKKEITKGRLVFKPGVSDACCHLIEQCLKKKPSKRLTIGQILLHRTKKVRDLWEVFLGE
ncbi:serine/threonine-protein kinase pim-1-like [Trichomycterus rosablanca]|uniref:serine/threonine-protein kinase pim-1-like n=2 Tax=Trichomycterus rosablanca TaxID=2290929 RepID=UPI002F35F72B